MKVVNNLIQLKELITESILYSCSWDYKKNKHYVYLTKSKMYKYVYNYASKTYSYIVYFIKDFSSLHCYPHTSGEMSWILITNRYNNYPVAQIEFPASEEGAKEAEKLFTAISKVIN